MRKHIKIFDLPPDVQIAARMIGLDCKRPYTRYGDRFYRPYRNWYACSVFCSDLSILTGMENAGIAEKCGGRHVGVAFKLTRHGLDWLGKNWVFISMIAGVCNMAKEICEDCGKLFETKNGFYCPECRKKRTSAAAKRNNLNQLGINARLGKCERIATTAANPHNYTGAVDVDEDKDYSGLLEE